LADCVDSKNQFMEKIMFNLNHIFNLHTELVNASNSSEQKFSLHEKVTAIKQTLYKYQQHVAVAKQSLQTGKVNDL